MKPLLLLVSAMVAGIAAGVALFVYLPSPESDTDALALRMNRLEYEVAELLECPLASPTYDHWEHFERHLDTYENLKFNRLPPDKAGVSEFGGEQWGGVMSGPTLDLLIAARIAQTLVPVYFDRVAVEGEVAQMTFYVLGARED